jgi:hypothetical protein
MAPERGTRVVRHQTGAGIPSCRRRTVAGRLQGSRSFRRRVLHLDPCNRPALMTRPPTRRVTRSSSTCCASRTTTVVLSTCCNERSVAVTHGALRCRPSAAQRISPGTVARFPSSRPTTGLAGLGSEMAPGPGTKVPPAPQSCRRPKGWAAGSSWTCRIARER